MNGIGEKAPWEESAAAQAPWPEFYAQNSHEGGWKEQTTKRVNYKSWYLIHTLH